MKKNILAATLALACAGAMASNFIRIPFPELRGKGQTESPATGSLPGAPGGPVIPGDPGTTNPSIPEVPKVAVIALDRTSLDFGTLTLEKSTPVSARQVLQVSNTGNAPATLSMSTSDDPYGLYATENPCGAELSPGATCNVGISFNPVIAGLGQNGVFSLSSNGGNFDVPLSGSAKAPLFSKVTITSAPTPAFTPELLVGATSAYKSVTIRNQGTGPTSLAMTLSGSYVLGTAADGSVCPTTLLANSQCTARVKFAPTVGGLAQKGQLQFVTEDGVNVAEFTGDARLSAFPVARFNATSTVSGPFFAGISYSQTVSLTNGGTANLTITGAPYLGVPSAEFNIASNTCTAGRVLQPNAGCSLTVNYSVMADSASRPPTTVFIPNSGIDKYEVPGVQSKSFTFDGASYVSSGWLRGTGLGSPNAPQQIGPYGQGATPTYDTGNGLKYTYEYIDARNMGNAPLTITAVQISGAPVALTGDCAGKTLARFDSCRMKVGFETLPVGVNNFTVRFLNTGVATFEAAAQVTIVP